MLKKLFSRDKPLPALPQRPFRFGVNFSGVVSRRELVETACEIEALGYDVFGISDHLHHGFEQLAPLLSLALVAEHTEHLQLQTLVLANDFRHPVVLANEAATLQSLSGGRFTLGLGAGWFAPDFKASGIAFHRAPERVARVAEAVDVLQGMWSGETFSFSGAHYTVAELRGIQTAPVPLLLGGSGPVMLALAARKAASVGLNPGLPLSAGNWQRGATPYADVTDDKLRWIAGAAGPRLAQLEIQSSVLAGGITADDPGSLLAPIEAAMGVSAAQLAGCPHFLAGTLEQCIEQVQSWRERWGVSYITFPHTMAADMAPLVAALRGK